MNTLTNNLKRRRHQLKTLLPGVQRSSRIAFSIGLSIGLLVSIIIALYASLGPQNNPMQRLFSTTEVSDLNAQLSTLQRDNQELKEATARSVELQKLDEEEREKLNLLITNLESENARLKEDLAFFEGFIPGSLEGTISLKRLQVTRDTVPNQYRYRALLIQGNDSPPVNLKVQLLIKTLNKDKPAVIVLPATPNAKDPQFEIRLTRFSRVAGTFSLPDGAKLQSVELRILEGGTIRAQSNTKL
ncbi:hypothetical protein NQT62_00240 [Limnobacter humi]|uniref:Uncharacterized protein n=1 Tax=Limnobacter humi TaxID=1778671 RepID=A0ABT1WBH3_9BURK|nr:DUF6776 family protein [Limnobacter humi]MCQ8894866.1 hypothetical protein [Limnobacter humi]